MSNYKLILKSGASIEIDENTAEIYRKIINPKENFNEKFLITRNSSNQLLSIIDISDISAISKISDDILKLKEKELEVLSKLNLELKYALSQLIGRKFGNRY